MTPYFPDLEILELVGRGGMGVVYKARQKRLDRLVALKILAPKIGQDPAFAERFAREARAMAMLSHPHVVEGDDMSDLSELLADCDVRGIRLHPAGDGGLTIDAPQAALTHDIVARLKDHKAELLALWSKPSSCPR